MTRRRPPRRRPLASITTADMDHLVEREQERQLARYEAEQAELEWRGDEREAWRDGAWERQQARWISRIPDDDAAA